MAEICVPARLDQLNTILSFIEEHLDDLVCPPALAVSIMTAAEEVFVNIAHYAYTSTEGTARLIISTLSDSSHIQLEFIDSGLPFDPLKQADPDISLSAEERPIGGLGILMVKKIMDQVSYQYIDGENHLILEKKISLPERKKKS